MKEVNNQEKLLDSVYKCLLCSYFTCNKKDFERHLKTKRCIARHEEENLKNTRLELEALNNSNNNVNRVKATDEFDDFVTNNTLTPVTSTQSLPTILNTKDSREQTRLRRRKVRSKKTNMKKTSSGDNIVISHVVLNVDENPIPVNDQRDEEEEDNYIFQSLYTQPFFIQQYIPGIYSWCVQFGKNCIKFINEMFNQAGENPISTHDAF